MRRNKADKMTKLKCSSLPFCFVISCDRQKARRQRVVKTQQQIQSSDNRQQVIHKTCRKLFII